MNNVIVEQQVERVDKAKTQSTTERKCLNNSHRFCKLLSFVTFWSNTNIDVLIHISAIRPGGTVQKLFGTSLYGRHTLLYPRLVGIGLEQLLKDGNLNHPLMLHRSWQYSVGVKKILLLKLRIAKNRNVVCFAQYQVHIYLQHRQVRT